MWVKAPHGWCNSRYQVSHVMGTVSPQTIMVNGIPHHLKDLHLFIDSGMSMCDSNNDISSESDHIIELNLILPQTWSFPKL